MSALRSPVTIAAVVAVAALLGLLAYGLSQNEPDRGIEQALARGERKPAPGFDLPRLRSGGRVGWMTYRGRVVVLQLLGVVVRAVPGRVAAARTLAQAARGPGRNGAGR